MSGYGFNTTERYAKRHSEGSSHRRVNHDARNKNEQYSVPRGSSRQNVSFSSADSDNEDRVNVDSRGRTKSKSLSRSRGRSLDNTLMQAEQAKPKPLARTKLTAHGTRKFMGEQKSYQIGDVLNFSDTNQEQWENSSFESKQSYHQRSSTNPREQYYMKENEYSELTELRMRTAQMEKTLRWWSECTSNWREKWSKVKIERNKAREEVKRIKVAYENAEKELNVLRQQKVLLINENTNLKQEVSDRSSQSNSDESVVKSFTPREITRKSIGNTTSVKSGSTLPTEKVDEEQINQKVAALQLKLEESVKTVQKERETNLNLNKRIENLEQELSSLNHKYEELKTGKQDLLKQLSRKQESHRLEVVRINTSLDEELENRNQTEKKIHDLRGQIEKLQEENTLEWGRRERLETEKLQLERENKRLKNNREELKVELERKFKTNAEDRENELHHTQAELHELREELNDLRRQSARNEKLLDDRIEELDHSRRRGEQHEVEVRALRSRVEDMKKQQTSIEDELDLSQNQYRKMLRIVEERDEEIEKINLQMEQAQTRARRNISPWPKAAFAKTTRDVDGGASSSESSCDV